MSNHIKVRFYRERSCIDNLFFKQWLVSRRRELVGRKQFRQFAESGVGYEFSESEADSIFCLTILGSRVESGFGAEEFWKEDSHRELVSVIFKTESPALFLSPVTGVARNCDSEDSKMKNLVTLVW